MVNIVMISSTGRCGIREYSHVLMDGFQQLGHRVNYIGVERHNNRALMQALRQVKADDDVVIFEYEPGIFWLGGLIRALAWLRFWRRKQVILSAHEIAAEKYAEARQIQWHLSRPVAGNSWFELLKLILATVDLVLQFLRLRLGLLIMGWLPHKVLVHSAKAAENIHLALANHDKVYDIPLLVKQLDLNGHELRHTLGVPDDTFAFITPGFFFRRKRIEDVIRQLPPEAELWVVGTESQYEVGYLAELKALRSQMIHAERVRLIQDYERMEQYLMAADAAVFYYADGFQSGVASLAVGAGKPCIFSDLPAFADLRSAGLVARSPVELRRAMEEIQDKQIYATLRAAAIQLRGHLSPIKIANDHLKVLVVRED